MIPDRLLESSVEEEIFAHYDFENQRAVFYANATAEDVLHEWFHHVDLNGLLPADLYAKMRETYGITDTSTDKEINTAREKAARDFVAYIRKKALSGMDLGSVEYPPEMEQAFGYMRAVFAEHYHAQEGFVETGKVV
jgi:hypothetical protein